MNKNQPYFVTNQQPSNNTNLYKSNPLQGQMNSIGSNQNTQQGIQKYNQYKLYDRKDRRQRNPIQTNVYQQFQDPQNRVQPKISTTSQNRQVQNNSNPLQRPVSQTPQQHNEDLRVSDVSVGDYRSQRKQKIQALSHNNFGNNKDQLKDQIKEKNYIVKELGNNKQFFEQQCKKKLNDYMSKIKNDIKPKVFEKVLKSNLHYIYKHYEGIKKQDPMAFRILDSNLQKIQGENNQIQNKNQVIQEQNKRLEQRLKDSANKIGLIKTQKQYVENLTKEDVEKQIEDIKLQNNQIKQQIQNIEIKKQQELYKIKVKYEMEGRKQMEEKAIMLALETPDTADPEEAQLKEQIRRMIKDIEYKEKLKKENYYYQLLKKKEELEAEYQKLNI